jgi:Macrocin-O-methyltransferase (TylF)
MLRSTAGELAVGSGVGLGVSRFVQTFFRSRKNDLTDLLVEDRQLITSIKESRLTFLSLSKLKSIATTCRSIEEAMLPGVFLEAGCALGGSAILLGRVKGTERPLQVYDVFEMIPQPTAEDDEEVHERYRTIVSGDATGIGGDKYYGYEDNLYLVVQDNLKRFGIDLERQHVSLIKGLVQDTMQIDQPVAFAHVDVDWYEPVMVCLERLFPALVVGGSIILDDYHDWGGCRKAADEYLARVAGQYALDDSAGSLKITRIGS